MRGLACSWRVRRSVKNACSVGAIRVIARPPGVVEQSGGVREQLGRRGEIGVGVAGLAVAEVGRKPRQPALDVDAGAVPIEQRAHREGVPEVVQSSAGPGRRRRSGLVQSRRKVGQTHS